MYNVIHISKIKIYHLQFKDKVVKQSNITEIIVGATVALVLVLISFGICYWCGFFKRTTPEERAKQDGLTDTGFDNHETNAKDETSRMLEA